LYWSRRGGVDVPKEWQPRAEQPLQPVEVAFLLCFAGVGLDFDLRQLAPLGVRPLIVAALGLVVVAACSLGLVLLTSGCW
jgi:uncharacterized membrane protein YadS